MCFDYLETREVSCVYVDENDHLLEQWPWVGKWTWDQCMRTVAFKNSVDNLTVVDSREGSV